MRLVDLLKDSNVKVSKKLEEIFAKAAEDIYPTMVRSGWSKYQITQYVLYVDLPEEDLNKIIIRAARYSKIWNFS